MNPGVDMNVENRKLKSMGWAQTSVPLSYHYVFPVKTIKELSERERFSFWENAVEESKRGLAEVVGRFYFNNIPCDGITIHHEAPFVQLFVNDDPTKAAFVMWAQGFIHEDAPIIEPWRREDAGTRVAPIRLFTKCGCESRTEFFPEPLPTEIQRSLPVYDKQFVRRFRRGGVNVFGTTVYHEV